MGYIYFYSIGFPFVDYLRFQEAYRLGELHIPGGLPMRTTRKRLSMVGCPLDELHLILIYTSKLVKEQEIKRLQNVSRMHQLVDFFFLWLKFFQGWSRWKLRITQGQSTMGYSEENCRYGSMHNKYEVRVSAFQIVPKVGTLKPASCTVWRVW